MKGIEPSLSAWEANRGQFESCSPLPKMDKKLKNNELEVNLPFPLVEEGEIIQDQGDCLELIFLTAARASEIKAL